MAEMSIEDSFNDVNTNGYSLPKTAIGLTVICP